MVSLVTFVVVVILILILKLSSWPDNQYPFIILGIALTDKKNKK